MSGQAASEMSRISLMLIDLTFEFKRLVSSQNVFCCDNSQGQTFEVTGINLQREVFSHGQLYVALPQIDSLKEQTIFISDESNETSNIIWREVFID